MVEADADAQRRMRDHAVRGGALEVRDPAGGARGCGGRSGKLTRHPALVDCLYLVRCGVPYDVAFELDEAERLVGFLPRG